MDKEVIITLKAVKNNLDVIIHASPDRAAVNLSKEAREWIEKLLKTLDK